jgi:hypothetical protein
MENIVRTVYGSALQTALLLGRPTVILPNTTLNEKLNIQATTAIGLTDRPKMQYITIGNGGHRTISGPNGITKPEPVQHRSTDAALYNHLPFVLRKLNNDLSAVEKAKYGLRRVEVHDGESYYAYYLKRQDLNETVIGLLYNTVVDGVTTSREFLPTASNLNPTPPDLTQPGVNVTTGDYVTAVAKAPFVMTENEAEEFLNVATVIYGDPGYAIISEMATCSGVDKLVSVEGGGSFNEVIGCQIVSFINTFFALSFSNGGISVELEVGATEPLFVLTNVSN